MIYNKPLFKEIFLISVVIAVTHYLANVYYLYWTVWWLDIVMHFLGGFLIGIMALFIFFISGHVEYPREHKIAVFSVVVGSVLIIGLVWELWEIFMQFTDVLSDKGDTIMDVILDTLGAVCAYFYGKNKI